MKHSTRSLGEPLRCFPCEMVLSHSFVALPSSLVVPGICGILDVNDPAGCPWTKITPKSKSAQCLQEDPEQWLLSTSQETHNLSHLRKYSQVIKETSWNNIWTELWDVLLSSGTRLKILDTAEKWELWHGSPPEGIGRTGTGNSAKGTRSHRGSGKLSFYFRGKFQETFW